MGIVASTSTFTVLVAYIIPKTPLSLRHEEQRYKKATLGLDGSFSFTPTRSRPQSPPMFSQSTSDGAETGFSSIRDSAAEATFYASANSCAADPLYYAVGNMCPSTAVDPVNHSDPPVGASTGVSHSVVPRTMTIAGSSRWWMDPPQDPLQSPPIFQPACEYSYGKVHE